MSKLWVHLIAFVSFAVSIAATLSFTYAQRQPIFRTERGGPILRVLAHAATGIQPKSVRVSPDGREVVVCNFGRPDRDNVRIYDATTLREVGRVEFAGNAVESAFSPDGRTLYISNFRRNRVEVIDYASRRVRAEIEVGSSPKTMVVSADGSRLYVANYFSHTVSVVNTNTNRVVRTLRTSERPRGIDILPGTRRLLVAAFHGDRIHVFDRGARTQRTEFPVCRYPRDIVVGAGQDPVFYLTCSLGHVGFYRAGDGGRPFGIAPAGRNPRSLGLGGRGRYLAVANFGSSDVTLIDTVERTHRRIAVPGASRLVGLAVHPGPEVRIFATSWDNARLFLLGRRGTRSASP